MQLLKRRTYKRLTHVINSRQAYVPALERNSKRAKEAARTQGSNRSTIACKMLIYVFPARNVENHEKALLSLKHMDTRTQDARGEAQVKRLLLPSNNLVNVSRLSASPSEFMSYFERSFISRVTHHLSLPVPILRINEVQVCAGGQRQRASF